MARAEIWIVSLRQSRRSDYLATSVNFAGKDILEVARQVHDRDLIHEALVGRLKVHVAMKQSAAVLHQASFEAKSVAAMRCHAPLEMTP